MGLLDTEAAKSKANITGPLLALLMQFHPPSTQDILIEEKLKCLCLYVHVAASMPESSVIQILGHLFTYLHGERNPL